MSKIKRTQCDLIFQEPLLRSAFCQKLCHYATEIKLGTTGVPENCVSFEVDTDGGHIHVQG